MNDIRCGWRSRRRKPSRCWPGGFFHGDHRRAAGRDERYELLGKVHTRWPDLPVLMITAYATPEAGAWRRSRRARSITWPSRFAPEELLHAVARCSERHRLLTQNAVLRARANETYQLDQIVGESPGVHELRQMILTRGADGRAGADPGGKRHGQGTGGGGAALLSERRQASYVAHQLRGDSRDNCWRAKLFGHEKGAFTGALKQKAGRVEEADGGSIFLDEIADMSRPLQAKLLRFLEDARSRGSAGRRKLRVDVRLIAATNRGTSSRRSGRTSFARTCSTG